LECGGSTPLCLTAGKMPALHRRWPLPDSRPPAKKLQRLQTLWGLYWKHRILPFVTGGLPSKEYQRNLRLGWVARRLGLEELASFKDLTPEQLDQAIDAIQAELPADLVKRRRRRSREEARSMGRAGRRGYEEKVVRPASADDLARIRELLAQLGWSQERFEGFLRSRSGPLGGRMQIRTQADSNKVKWALKGILKQERAEAKQLQEVPA